MGPAEDVIKCDKITKEKKEIERTMDDLEREVGNTQNLVDTLLQLIQPITGPDYPTSEGGGLKEEGTTTELGGAVYNYVTRLRSVNAILSDAISRIEL